MTLGVPAALWALLRIIALCCYQHLSSQLEELDVEMQNMTLELANVLSTMLRRDDAPPVS